jgi:citrate lyase beta subunit
MRIQAYQFIKYDRETSIAHIERVYNAGAVVCFDFEDGILNPMEEGMNSLLKEEARERFNILYSMINNFNREIRVGVRLNDINTSEFGKDLNAMSGKRFESILIPKINYPGEVQIAAERLAEFKIEYEDLIPIIETKKSFENLESILELNKKVRKAAFGHCDYNLEIESYPFFHQDSLEYWRWISAIISKGEKYGLQLINSPYLNTDNEFFFCSMLEYISTKFNNICGQVTLTTRQSVLCNTRNSCDKNFTKYLENKNRISPEKNSALELVNDFEANNKQKGLSKCHKNFISLQEYIASKKQAEDERIVKEMCFIGGCFPVQYNIVYEELFHQKLRRKIESRFKVKLNVNILRYERFSTVFEKLERLSEKRELDFVIFHIRPEPFFRLIKLYYKYTDNEGRLRRSLNLPYFDLLNPEKYDILDVRRFSNDNAKERDTLFHKLLITMNYISGIMTGNKHNALQRYFETTKRVIEFCEANKIKYFILGPNLRSNNYIEPTMCRALDLFFSGRIEKQRYITGFEEDGVKGMIQENGIHATQEYHDLIAESLFKAIENIFQ